jgi:sugar O-acyltransferase (sialic acid O-acetyltransferase NeuD family)
MNQVVIFGTGVIAQLAHFYLSTDSQYEVCGFTVDQKYLDEKTFQGLPVVAFEEIESLFPPSKVDLFIALSYTNINKLRSEKYQAAKNKGYKLISYISSKATKFSNVTFGENCFILENNTIQPFVTIGDNVTLWSGNHIGHHSRIDDHCFIASQVVISGGVHVKNHSFIGVNATLRDHIIIAEESVIGAGAIIMKDTLPKSVFVPTPTSPANITSDKLRRL